jgi:hypothetical protein
MNIFQGIIDVYDENSLDLDDAWKQGVRAILHQTSAGLYRVDSKYASRKATALQKGFLWCGYHLLSAEDCERQLDVFLSIEDGKDPRVALALDWEHTRAGTILYADLRNCIISFNKRMKPLYPNRYPLLYGGWTIRETPELEAGDPVFAKCLLWYQRYKSSPDGIPTKTWPTYTLWQFDDEKRHFGAPPPSVLPGADWNRFVGTLDDLQKAWPFAEQALQAPAGAFAAGALMAAAGPLSSPFASRLASVAVDEWQFFGKQTYDSNNHVAHAGHKEGEDGWYQRVGKYWLEGVSLHGLDGRDHGTPWSAAFISWVERTAGAGQRFRYSSQHSVYIFQAIRDLKQKREEAGYWGWRLNELKPSVGDLVCWARQGGIDYDHQNNGDYAGHCDIVVAVSANEVEVMGGNVGDSVTRRPLRLDQNGFLIGGEHGGEVLFGLMQNRMT